MLVSHRFSKICVLSVLAATAIAVLTLGMIGMDEIQPARERLPLTRLSLKGVYYTPHSSAAYLIPRDGILDVKGKTSLRFEGNFSADIPQNQLLIFRLDNASVEVYVNDTLVGQTDADQEKPDYIQSTGNGWSYLVSPGIRSGDEIRILMKNFYSNHTVSVYRQFLTQMYAGYAYPLIFQHLRDGLPNFLGALLLICLGVIVAFYAALLKNDRNGFLSAALLAGLCFSAGVWFFIDFQTIEYFIPYGAFNNALDLLALMLTASLLPLSFAYEFQCPQSRLLSQAASLSFSLSAPVLCLMQFFAGQDLCQSILWIEILIVLCVAALLISLQLEWRACPRDARLKWLIAGGSLICIGAAGDLVISFFQIDSSLSCFKLCFLLFSLLRVAQLGFTARDFSRKRSRMETLESQHTQLEKVLKYQQLISEATKGLYESILEIDLTHDRFVGDSSAPYLKSRGVDANVPFSQALRDVAMTAIVPEDRDIYLKKLMPFHLLRAFEQNVETVSVQFRSTDASGSLHWIEINGRMFYWSEDESIRLVLFRKNIDDEKLREEALSEKAQRDILTDTLNKAAFENKARLAVSNATGTTLLALMILDIDHFKSINDIYGHQMGDYALAQFAKALRGQFREEDLVGRIGGDEFAVLLRYNDKGWLQLKADQLIQELALRLEKDGAQLSLTASVGVSTCLAGITTYEQLFKQADEALYQVKTAGRNSYRLYDGKTEGKGETGN